MISMIAAIDKNSGLGYRNQLLTHLPNDMKRFKQLTEGKVCVQGRLTYDSIVDKLGTSLPNRTNIVLTKNKKFNIHPSTFVFNSVKEVLKQYKNHNNSDELMIIGGSQIYTQFMPFADKIYLTIIDNEFKNVDTYFPRFSLEHFKPIEHIKNHKDDKHSYDYSFVTYERI